MPFFIDNGVELQVLDLNWHDYQRTGWGKVYLHADFHGGWNQRWEFLNGEIACKGTQHRQIPNLRLDVHGSCTGNGSKVGVFQRNGAQNQKWTLKGVSFNKQPKESENIEIKNCFQLKRHSFTSWGVILEECLTLPCLAQEKLSFG